MTQTWGQLAIWGKISENSSSGPQGANKDPELPNAALGPRSDDKKQRHAVPSQHPAAVAWHGVSYHICTRDVRLARYDAYFSPRQSNWGCFVSVRSKEGRSKDNNTGFAMNLLGLATISIWEKATFVIICLGKQIVSWNLMTVHVGWYDATRHMTTI